MLHDSYSRSQRIRKEEANKKRNIEELIDMRRDILYNKRKGKQKFCIDIQNAKTNDRWSQGGSIQSSNSNTDVQFITANTAETDRRVSTRRVE